jgi:hypothetical protein
LTLFNVFKGLTFLFRLVDGKHNYDEICCMLAVPYSAIDPYFDHCIYR